MFGYPDETLSPSSAEALGFFFSGEEDLLSNVSAGAGLSATAERA